MVHRRSLIALFPLLFACAHVAPASLSKLDEEALRPEVSVPDSQVTPPEPEATEPSVTEEPREISIAAVGDVMLGSTFPENEPRLLPPEDGVKVLAEAAPVLSAADLAFGNLEGPMIDGGTSSKCGRSAKHCYAFRMPTRYGQRLKDAGFDAMGLANNHALDFGPAGRESTRRALEALEIAHTGEVGDVARLIVDGRQVALIAFSISTGTHDLNDLESAEKAVSELAATSDIVVVSFHGGAEGAAYQHVPQGPELFLGENRGDLRTFTHSMVDAGASLLLGSGPHVVRGMEVYRGRLIAYSLGNFATYGGFSLGGPNGLAPILEVRLASDGTFRSGRIHPFRQVKPGGPRLDPTGEVIRVMRELSRQDFGESAVRVSDDGSILPPALPIAQRLKLLHGGEPSETVVSMKLVACARTATAAAGFCLF